MSAAEQQLRDRAEFRELATQFKLRAPASDLRGMVRGVGRGVCLQPLLVDEVWFGLRLEPEDGDLVLVEYSEEWLRQVHDHAALESPEWQAKWRETDFIEGALPRRAAKIYRVRDGVPYALSRDYAVRLDRIGRVIGVARHIVANGVPAYGSCGPRPRRVHSALAVLCVMMLFWNNVIGRFV